MNVKPEPLNTLQDIKQMMERSSRFISLSGLSGVAAGCCALVGAWFANGVLHADYTRGNTNEYSLDNYNGRVGVEDVLNNQLFQIALITFIAAFIFAFLFTYLRSKKNNTPLWGYTAQRLMINVSIPMVVGGLFMWKIIQEGIYGLIAPGCLIFYGLALVNASKYTLKEVRYLGFGQIILGVFNLWSIGNGLYFWAIGFGALHIIYGIVMWWKYEKA